MQRRIRRNLLESPPPSSLLRFCSTIDSSSPASPSPTSSSHKPALQALARIKSPRDAVSAAHYRDHGLVPAVVYDGLISHPPHAKRPHPLPQQTTSLLFLLRERDVSDFLQNMGRQVFMSTVFALHVRCNHLKDSHMEFASTHLVLPRTVNFDDKGRITNLRFVKAVEGVKMKLNCPLVISGAEDCIGVKRGGVLKRYYSYLPLSCAPERLPTVVEADVRKLDVGQVMIAADVQVQGMVDLHPDLDPASPICAILTVGEC